jgi:hypothetical protein
MFLLTSINVLRRCPNDQLHRRLAGLFDATSYSVPADVSDSDAPMAYRAVAFSSGPDDASCCDCCRASYASTSSSHRVAVSATATVAAGALHAPLIAIPSALVGL